MELPHLRRRNNGLTKERVRFVGAALLACLAVLPSPVATQPRTEPDRAIDRIRQAAGQRSELADIARNLTDIYGPRLTGSPQLKAAADFVMKRLTAWGISRAGYERWGPFGPGWTNDRFVALALAPQAYPLLAFPKAWTPATPGDVIADAVFAPVERESDFDRYRGTLRGKFVLTMPAGVGRVLSDPATAPAADQIDFARKRLKFYVDQGVAALIERSRGEDGILFVGDGRLSDDSAFAGGGLYPWPDEVPLQIVLASEQYDRIARTLAQNVTVTLEINAASSYHPAEPDSFNVVAEIPGTDLSQQVVMFGAHLDSWHAGTGATDNAAGCAVVLEAMRILKGAGLTMRRTVRVALWTGSEQGGLGSRAYVREHFADPPAEPVKPEHARLSAYFNVDGGTGSIRGIAVEGNKSAGAIFAGWMAPFAQNATPAAPGQARSSDHTPFSAAGLPAFQFIQDPLDDDSRTRHSNMDVFDRLRMTELMQNAVIVASFVYQAANRPELLPRK